MLPDENENEEITYELTGGRRTCVSRCKTGTPLERSCDKMTDGGGRHDGRAAERLPSVYPSTNGKMCSYWGHGA